MSEIIIIRKTKKAVEHEDDSDAKRYGLQRLGNEAGRVWNQRTSRDPPNSSIVKIDQNTEKSPGDLRRLVILRPQMKDHQFDRLARSIIIIIIIIMSYCQHEYPWSSLTTSPYRSSPLAGLQGYIPYPHISAVCIFELAVLLLLGHMRGSIGVHHLWDRPCFSSDLHVWFV